VPSVAIESARVDVPIWFDASVMSWQAPDTQAPPWQLCPHHPQFSTSVLVSAEHGPLSTMPRAHKHAAGGTHV